MRSWLIPAHCATLLCIASFPATSGELQSLKHLLQTHEREIDFAAVKIAIDGTIDPSTDATAINKQLDALVASIARRIPAGASNRTKLDVLLSSLYEPGSWNDQLPFQYDLEDPFGKVLQAALPLPGGAQGQLRVHADPGGHPRPEAGPAGHVGDRAGTTAGEVPGCGRAVVEHRSHGGRVQVRQQLRA
jgi:hypothetical protein